MDRQDKIARILKIYVWNYEHMPAWKLLEILRAKYFEELDKMTEEEIYDEYEDAKRDCGICADEEVDELVIHIPERNSKGE